MIWSTGSPSPPRVTYMLASVICREFHTHKIPQTHCATVQTLLLCAICAKFLSISNCEVVASLIAGWSDTSGYNGRRTWTVVHTENLGQCLVCAQNSCILYLVSQFLYSILTLRLPSPETLDLAEQDRLGSLQGMKPNVLTEKKHWHVNE